MLRQNAISNGSISIRKIINTMSAPFFSIIIPAYNREDYIEQCLDSVFAQSFNDYEIIVVDDGSTDRTVDILEGYGERIRLVCQDNAGAGVARQTGCSQARGVYIAFLDSDDLWFPWTLNTYHQIIEKEAMPSVLWGANYGFKGDDAPEIPECGVLDYLKSKNFYSLGHPCPMVATCNFVIKREAFESTSGFFSHRHLCEDTSLFLESGLCEGAVYMESPFMVAHRDTPESFIKHSHYWYDGLMYIRAQEASGAYPGGQQWGLERQWFIAMNFRSASVRLMKRKQYAYAWKLFFISMPWQIRLRRFRFLFGLPVVFLFSLFGSDGDM